MNKEAEESGLQILKKIWKIKDGVEKTITEYFDGAIAIFKKMRWYQKNKNYQRDSKDGAS